MTHTLDDANSFEPNKTDSRNLQEAQDNRRRISETPNKTRKQETATGTQKETQRSIQEQ